ncbi:MAG: CDP-glycerol glycerophosphotransferase family protein, partial [Clostridia bacterium]|nr:CDP-glycerol glycerophosphotransferase family protein [Clostridia bacterium]
SAWTKEVFNPFSESLSFNKEKLLTVLEEENYVFMYKPHFYDSDFVIKNTENNRFITIDEDDFGELYNFIGNIDILITDYSSIYFDFITTRKPVILTPFDYEEYVTNCRSHYFDYSELEGVRAKDWNDVIDILQNGLYQPVSEDNIKQFAEFSDGNSCKKIIDYLNK